MTRAARIAIEENDRPGFPVSSADLVRGHVLDKVEKFHSNAGITTKSRSIRHDDFWWMIYCFAERRDAANGADITVLDTMHPEVRVAVRGAIDHREMQRPFVVAIGRAEYFEPTPQQFYSEQC